MNLTQLEYLKELYVRGSFSLAAQKLGVTQPALSLQIQKLEEELEFKLLDRTRRPLKFTEEGIVFYEKAIDILKQLEQLKQIAHTMSEEVKGNIKVGIIPTLAPYLIPLFIEQLNTEFPALQVEIEEIKTEAIIAGLKMGNIDCGIISTPISSKDMIFKPMFYERFFIYVSEGHSLFGNQSIDIHDIDMADVWYLEEGNCFQNQVNSICNIDKQDETSQNLIYRTNSIESLRRVVENKNGLTFIPELATVNIPVEQEELLKEFKSNQPYREISMVVSKKYTKERQVNVIQKIIQENIPKRMLQRSNSWIVDTLL